MSPRKPQLTPLGALIREAMEAEDLSYRDVENRGGPSMQTTWNLVKRAAMTRPPSDETQRQLVKALPSLSTDAVRDAIAASMGLAPETPTARDPWTSFGRTLAEKATATEQDLVLAAARGMWDQLRKRRR